jgi:hypothetical protein
LQAIWLLPVITLLWVNLHGGFMLMFALLGVEALACAAEELRGGGGLRRSRQLVVVGVVSALCGLVNPSGLEAYRYAFLLLGHSDMLNCIWEWWSPNFRNAPERPLSALILLLACAGGASRQRGGRDLLLLVGLLHSALFSQRHVPLLAIAGAPILAQRLAECAGDLRHWMAGQRWSVPGWNMAASLALAVLLGSCLVRQVGEVRLLAALRQSVRGEPAGSWFSRSAGLAYFPVRAVEYLHAQPGGGRLFNDYGWGGYCDWRLWPRYHVFIDGRAEVFFETSYFDYRQIADTEPGWQAKLRRWGADTVLIPPEMALASALAREQEWRLIYQDRRAVVYRRVDLPAPAAVTADARAGQDLTHD